MPRSQRMTDSTCTPELSSDYFEPRTQFQATASRAEGVLTSYANPRHVVHLLAKLGSAPLAACGLVLLNISDV